MNGKLSPGRLRQALGRVLRVLRANRVECILFSVSLALNLYGMARDLPQVTHPDEPKVVRRALAMGTGDLNPHFFLYPTLWIYLVFLAQAAAVALAALAILAPLGRSVWTAERDFAHLSAGAQVTRWIEGHLAPGTRIFIDQARDYADDKLEGVAYVVTRTRLLALAGDAPRDQFYAHVRESFRRAHASAVPRGDSVIVLRRIDAGEVSGAEPP